MQGHIRRRTKGSWTVVVNLGPDPITGKRRQLWRSVKGSKRDAEQLLVQLLHQRDQGIDAPAGQMTVAAYLEKWLATYAAENTAPATYRRYEQLMRLYIVPSIGSVTLGRLRPLQIQEAYSRARAQRSAKTVLQIHRVLRVALRHAVQWQLLGRNPADAVKPPPQRRFDPPALDLGDIQRLLDAANETPHGDLVYLALMTGLRLGELRGLRWQDTDLQAGVLSVRQTCQWLPGSGFEFRQPKTHRSVRPVALSPATVERMRLHRTRQDEERAAAGSAYQGHDLVFADAIGRPVAPWSLRASWRRILRDAGLAGVRFHDLRHAHASLLLREGVHPKIVSERLGHSSVNITLDLYSHVAPSLQVQAAARLDRLVGR